MTFAWPYLLWLIAIPVGLLLWELMARRRGAVDTTHPKILRAEISSNELHVTREPARIAGKRVRPWLALGLTFAIVALARPQWGRIDEPVFDQSREIIIAIDLSRSMMSPDVKPSRLDRAKLLVQALLEKLKGERVGLIVFSGTAFLQSPLSADYEILREFLPALNPDFLPEGGTNYRAMIDTAVEAFSSGTAADRFLIVLSDGEATDDSWQSAVEQLRNKGIRVIGLGVGTAAGSMIPDGSGGFVKDERGAVVMSKLESGTLQQLAQETHGLYRDASTWIDLASLINQTVDAGKRGAFVDTNTVRRVERFQWPLALAVWLLLVSAYYEFPVQPRARAIALRPRHAPVGPSPSTPITTAAGLFAFALLGTMWFAGPPVAVAAVKKATTAEEASPADAPGTAASMGKIVSRLSQKPSLTGPDLSELAHETLAWGHRLKDAGQRVPDGPVRDALEAVDQLAAKGDKLANWDQLRSDLQALLDEQQKPPPPKQQQQQQNKDDSQKKDQSQDNQQKSQGGQSQKQSDQQKPQDQSSQSPQQQQAGQLKQDQNSQSADQKQNAGSPKQDSEPKDAQPFAFGDMKKPQPPPPSQQDMQKVGGAQEKKDAPPADAALAVPLDKLEQLRNQDSPAQLFEQMQPERSLGQQSKTGKNW